MSTPKKSSAAGAGSHPVKKATSVVPARAAKSRLPNIRASIEHDILSGRLTPGTKLDEEALAAKFGASRTPVREALQQLASQGHVELRPHVGAFVAQMSVSELGQMFEAMSFLESACAGLAAIRHTAADRQQLGDAHAACVKAAKKNDPAAFYAANSHFHECIYAASHNDYLRTETLRLGRRLDAYRRALTFHSGLMTLTIKEHETILQSILEMNEAAATSSMRVHLDTLRDDAVSMAQAFERVTQKKAA